MCLKKTLAMLPLSFVAAASFSNAQTLTSVATAVGISCPNSVTAYSGVDYSATGNVFSVSGGPVPKADQKIDCPAGNKCGFTLKVGTNINNWPTITLAVTPNSGAKFCAFWFKSPADGNVKIHGLVAPYTLTAKDLGYSFNEANRGVGILAASKTFNACFVKTSFPGKCGEIFEKKQGAGGAGGAGTGPGGISTYDGTTPH